MKIENLTAYEVIEKENLSDIHSTGWILRHKKTGARVMLVENEEENKVFNIAFRTPPADSTGVAHILEHSVLCGSKEFPLKDPFVELVKGSLNTFLNAMTYPDKTCYPVASCNDQDFQNLMHVYLDAVFFPKIYEKEEIFRQEGWNYHLEDVEGPLTINGVVYNEMKGAFSSPDEVLEREIMNTLFPDTTYGCESGGDPNEIPNLTYEGFLNFHRAYYHPSNSFIYLYGNMDMAEKLTFIDEHYLSKFEALEIDSRVKMQEPFEKCRDLCMEYPVSESEGEEDNTYLAYSKVIGTAEDAVLAMAFEILDYTLLSAPGAPLKKALLDAGIGKDIYGSYDDGILQPYFTVVAKGANRNQKEEFEGIIRKVLEDTVANGIDKAAVKAGINYFEFRYREADFSSYPKGLMYGLSMLGNWLYSDENPFSQVKLLPVFEQLKDYLEEGYFEKLIQKYLLENEHGAILTLVPSMGLAAKKEKALEEKLEQYKNSCSKEELQQMAEKTAALKAFQEAEEDPANLECIPMLKREDIRKNAGRFFNEELDADGSLLLYHEVCTNGIGYLDLLFDLSHISEEMIPYLGLLKSVLGYVDTENYNYGELFNVINTNSGGIYCGIEMFDQAALIKDFRAMFGVRGKALYAQIPFMFEMIREILEKSNLHDTKRLYEIIAEIKSRAQASLVSAGHSTAVLRASSYSNPASKFQDEMAGIAYYQFIEKLEKDFEAQKEDVIEKLELLLKQIFRPENLYISYTGERESVEVVKEQVCQLKANLCTEPVEKHVRCLCCEKKNEAFTTSGQVQYAAQAGNFCEKGFVYTGALDILKVILSYDYLWMNVRVKGGAYGCMSGFKRNGSSFFVSYRDPNLGKTYEVYEGVTDYVRNFCANEREMTKYIIGTISGKDTPKTPQMKGSISKIAYFSGVTEEMVQKERDEILNASEKDIRELAPLMEAILSDGSRCTVGSESAIEKEKDLFGEVKSLINC